MPRSRGLLQQQAHRGGLGIGVDGAGDGAEVRRDVLAERDARRHLALVVADVGVHLRTRPGRRPRRRRARCRSCASGCRLPRRDVDAHGLQAEPVEGQAAADGEQHGRALDARAVVEVEPMPAVRAGPGVRRDRPRAGVDGDAVTRQPLRHGGGAALVVARQDARARAPPASPAPRNERTPATSSTPVGPAPRISRLSGSVAGRAWPRDSSSTGPRPGRAGRATLLVEPTARITAPASQLVLDAVVA